MFFLKRCSPGNVSISYHRNPQSCGSRARFQVFVCLFACLLEAFPIVLRHVWGRPDNLAGLWESPLLSCSGAPWLANASSRWPLAIFPSRDGLKVGSCLSQEKFKLQKSFIIHTFLLKVHSRYSTVDKEPSPIASWSDRLKKPINVRDFWVGSF